MKSVTKHTGSFKEAEDGLWKVLAKNFPELSLSMKEFIDNAISAIQARQKIEACHKGKINIIIRETTVQEMVKYGFDKIPKRENSEFKVFKQVADGTIFEQLSLQLDYDDTLYLIEIHDNGIGISNFDDLFLIGKGKSSVTESSFLNEHGIGVKHALAQANNENDAWEIRSIDTQDLKNNRYKKVSAPFQWHKDVYDWVTVKEDDVSEIGTTIKVVVTEDNLRTLGSRISKNASISIETAIKFFKEDIAATYNDYILKDIDIEIEYISRKPEFNIVSEIVKPIRPKFEIETKKIEIPLELMENSHSSYARIELIEGFIEESKNDYYFRHTTDSPKVLTYLNGRLISDLWDELFTADKHNKYNQYQLIVNIFIDNKSFIPSTNATKTNFVIEDNRYKEIIKLIKEYIPQPKAFRVDLTEAERKKIFIENLMRREREGLCSDLYIGAEDNMNNLGKADAYITYIEDNQVHHELFEFKKGELKLQHLFQLLGYVHFKKMQENPLKKAVLVVDSLPNNEKEMNYNEFIYFLNNEIDDVKFEVTTYEKLEIPVLKDYKGKLISKEMVNA